MSSSARSLARLPTRTPVFPALLVSLPVPLSRTFSKWVDANGEIINSKKAKDINKERCSKKTEFEGVEEKSPRQYLYTSEQHRAIFEWDQKCAKELKKMLSAEALANVLLNNRVIKGRVKKKALMKQIDFVREAFHRAVRVRIEAPDRTSSQPPQTASRSSPALKPNPSFDAPEIRLGLNIDCSQSYGGILSNGQRHQSFTDMRKTNCTVTSLFKLSNSWF